MKFFNIDFHISVIADVRSLLGELGHIVDSLSLSGHTWVFGKQPDRIPSLDGMSRTAFGQRECDKFYQAEKGCLADYDGFIVTYPTCLAGLYEKTGKPVIAVVATRYDIFNRTPESKEWLDATLHRMHASGQLILLTNNAYDAWDCERRLGINPQVIPSICGYTGVMWAPKNPPFLHGRVDLCGLQRLRNRHSWNDVATSAACVSVPYNASLMSIFERHTMGMPLAIPSPEWVLRNPSSLTDLRVAGEPDACEIEAATRLADWYCGELQGITLFDSEEHLSELLRSGLPPVTGMDTRKRRVLDQWQTLLHEIQ